MTIAKLLKVRATIKKKKPHFILSETKKIKKLQRRGWRKPRGLHHKMRHGFKGYRRCVEVGWGSPAEVKGLHRSGMEMVIVNNPKELESINPEKQGILIGGTVGTRKKIQIIELAMKKKIAILNLKDPGKYIEAKAQALKEFKEERQKKKEDKKKKKEAAPKKSIEQKVEKKGEETEEEKKEREKKEKDKLLIKETK